MKVSFRVVSIKLRRSSKQTVLNSRLCASHSVCAGLFSFLSAQAQKDKLTSLLLLLDEDENEAPAA